MAKGKKKRKGKKVSLTAIAWIFWFLNRMGILTTSTFAALMTGDPKSIMLSIENEFKNNFTSTSGIALTLSSGVVLGLITLIVKWLMRGSTVPVSGKITSIGA